MTFIQILVLVIVVCVSAVECIVTLARASVRKAQVGVPSDACLLNAIQGAFVSAENTGSVVNIYFNDDGTTISYMPKEALEGDDEECSTE